MEQTTLFNAEKENKAINQAQQLLEVGIFAQTAGIQLLAQLVVVWVLNKTFAQGQ